MSSLPLTPTTLCILRHAERPPIPPGTFGNELSITAAGKAAAERWGAEVGAKYPVARIFTSPVLRCVQTAEAIGQAAEATAPVAPHRHLGEPSVFVADVNAAGRHFLEAGPRKIVGRLLRGERFEGMREPKAGTDLLLRTLLADAPPGLTVCVTHDAILACVQNVLTGLPYDEAHWPDYLDAVWLDVTPQGLQVTWRDQHFRYDGEW
jgi:broad specificity phosphatase PhoE